MEFRKTTGIYQQIADFGLDQVLSGSWEAGEKVPSVRSLASEVGVTPNTVMRAYRDLEDLGIIETRRGLGFFVAAAGAVEALAERRRQFVSEQLPELWRTLRQLALEPAELVTLLENYDSNPNSHE